MGWAIGWDYNWHRDIGYGVPAVCDYPTCRAKIDRGLGFVCGGEPYGGEYGCGLFFCDKHLEYVDDPGAREERPSLVQVCESCAYNIEIGPDRWEEFKKPFDAKPDVPRWIRWKLKDASWEEWRRNNPEEVREMKETLEKVKK